MGLFLIRNKIKYLTINKIFNNMKTIKSLKDITTLEVGDEVVFGNLEYDVRYHKFKDDFSYFLHGSGHNVKNDTIFITLGLSPTDFVKNLGIETLPVSWIFPEVKSLEALTAIVSALFKEHEKRQNELPKTWEEFCVKNKIKKGESYISRESQIRELFGSERDSITDRNVCTSKSEAEAFLALKQLRQLRKCYIGDWEPDWTEPSNKYCIVFYDVYGFKINTSWCIPRVLSFPTEELANQFLTNFRNLLEIAKPLL